MMVGVSHARRRPLVQRRGSPSSATPPKGMAEEGVQYWPRAFLGVGGAGGRGFPFLWRPQMLRPRPPLSPRHSPAAPTHAHRRTVIVPGYPLIAVFAVDPVHIHREAPERRAACRQQIAAVLGGCAQIIWPKAPRLGDVGNDRTSTAGITEIMNQASCEDPLLGPSLS
jgi:hypothetical protein